MAGSRAGSAKGVVGNGPRLPDDVLLGGDETAACPNGKLAGSLCPVEMLSGSVIELLLFDKFSGSSWMFSDCSAPGLRFSNKSSLLYLLSMLHSS